MGSERGTSISYLHCRLIFLNWPAATVRARNTHYFSLDFVPGLTDINLLWYESRGAQLVSTRGRCRCVGAAQIECRTLISNHQGGFVTETDIFLSYARRDRPTARVIAETLGNEGFSVWWDASLHSGETFDEVIERNLKDAKAVVVLWSPASVASRWVRAEATLADRRNKLVPAIIEACDRPIIFELTHTSELTDWSGDKSDPRWRTFVEDLHRLIKSGAHEDIKEPHEDRSEAAFARPLEAISSAGRANRQPLRPGNHEVLVSDCAGREPSVPKAPARAFPSPAEIDVHCLAVEEGELSEEVIIVGASGVKIGRTKPADVVLSHKSISREHCIIGVANDELLVTDLNSTNGTFIDDVRISRATILPVGSILRIGEIKMRHALGAREFAQQPRLTGAESGRSGRFAAAS